jgi:UDP-3-O-[3-hydroxymyristoyl] glucosamine N-acyltransferase
VDRPALRTSNPYLALARALAAFHPADRLVPGIHATVVVAADARVDAGASIGPFCVISSGAEIEAGTLLDAQVFVGANVRIGRDCRVFPQVTLREETRLGDRVTVHAGAVIGADGFGYAREGARYVKIPQVGRVILEDDVEIGANVTIDRGALGPTTIGRGTKIDNLVQIAHNVTIGEHSLVVAQVGIAGSTKLGNYVTLGGQVGLSGHLKIGNRVSVAAQSGVMHDIPDGEKWFGYPAQPDRKTKRQILAIQQLPQLLRRVTELERRAQGRHPEGSPPTPVDDGSPAQKPH